MLYLLIRAIFLFGNEASKRKMIILFNPVMSRMFCGPNAKLKADAIAACFGAVGWANPSQADHVQHAKFSEYESHFYHYQSDK